MIEVYGKWHQIKTRCQKCGRPRDRVYVVQSGPTTGVFCGLFCYQSARKEMDDAKTTKVHP